MPRVHTQIARKDYPNQGIKKGDRYFKWSMRTHGAGSGVTCKSLNQPRYSQLTLSAFYSQQRSLDEQLEDLTTDTVRDEIEGIYDEISSLLDETRDNLEAIPDHLQESHVNTERVEMLEEWMFSLEGVKDDVPDEVDEPIDEPEEPEEDDFEDSDDYNDAFEKWEAAVMEWTDATDEYNEYVTEVEAALDNIQAESYPG